MDDEAFQPRLPWWLSAPSNDLPYRVYARGYAVASALRLTLPDAVQDAWLAPTLLHWLGVALLLANGCFAGWVACAIGVALPILFLRDQLTQSAYLLACALAACVAFAPRDRMRSLLPAVRVVTLSVYALAAFHKLNGDFVDPAVSCANAGLRVLSSGAPWLPPAIADTFTARWWPWLFIGCEAGVALSLWRRPALGVTLACALHIPLTILFAPGFAFTMMSGWLAFFAEDELRALWGTMRRRWGRIAFAGGVPAILSRAVLFDGRWSSDPDWCIKEVLLWLALAWLIEAATTRYRDSRLFRGRGAWQRGGGRVALVVGALFALNGLSVHAGLQFHRTGAMLSNLRIDPACHNHLLLGAWRDPYLRIERVAFAPGRAAPGVAEHAVERLWGPDALYRERRRWCAIHDEPLAITLSRDGVSYRISDFCAADGWPFDEPWLPGMRRFQRNLTRACHQRCIH